MQTTTKVEVAVKVPSPEMAVLVGRNCVSVKSYSSPEEAIVWTVKPYPPPLSKADTIAQ